MLKDLQGARLGIFIFLGTVMFTVAVFLLGNKDMLFKDTFDLFTYFSSVEGLREGAAVQYVGIKIGSVKKIEITSDSAGKVKVYMKINSDSRKFIRKDAITSVETEGLVGNKILIISGGSTERPIVEEGDVLVSKTPINFSQIIGETQSMLGYIKNITKEFSEVAEKVNKGEGTFGKLINDDKLYKNLEKTTETADYSLRSFTKGLLDITESAQELSKAISKVVLNVDTTIVGVNDIIAKVNRGEGVLGALTSDKSGYDSVKSIINNLVETSFQAKLASRRLAENMEALKHNWLFKGYFERRGYWDKEQYEIELDNKLDSLRLKENELDEKIKKLKELEKKLDKK